MKTGVILLNFGEPELAGADEVVSFLERIFAANASVEGDRTPTEARRRARALAEARAPELMEEYLAIGGSPLNRQAERQADLLADELRRRGHDADTFVGMQFTPPSIGDAVGAARAAGAEAIVALPVYPLPGPSTTAAALATVRSEVRTLGWTLPVHEVPIWHRDPRYLDLRVEAIRGCLREHDLRPGGPETVLVCSAHGTPLKYLHDGSRYVERVEEFCEAVARELRTPRFRIGYQNHANRPGVEWTAPDVETVIRELGATPGVERVVVDPVSFMHEQSETLVELDRELREVAESVGLAFRRVPIPFDAPAFIDVLADAVESAPHRAEGAPTAGSHGPA